MSAKSWFSSACRGAGLAVGLLALQISAATADCFDIDAATKNLDRAVKPGDDFDAFVNGNWRSRAKFLPGRSRTGIFPQVHVRLECRIRNLVRKAMESSAPVDSFERKIADFYAAFLDEAAIEFKGLTPLQPQIDEVASISNQHDLAHVLGKGLRSDVDPFNNTNLYTENLFGLFVSLAPDDPTKNVPYLLQGGLGMKGRDDYLSNMSRKRERRSKYQNYIAAILKLAAMPNADIAAKEVLNLERKIARVHASDLESRVIKNANNVWDQDKIAREAPGLEWSTYFEAAGLADQPVFVLWQPKAIKGLSALTRSEHLNAWKSYLIFHLINRYADVLPKAYYNKRFELFEKELNGTKQQKERWQRAADATSDALGDAVGQLYVRRYFSAEAKEKSEAIIRNIVAAFGRRIDAIGWMQPETKREAKAKLAALRIEVGYPEMWRDYSTLEISSSDAFGNWQRAELFEYRHQLAKLKKSVNRGEWWIEPQTADALNLPIQNAINIPMANLEDPLFDSTAGPAFNYGFLGSIIGHEISHAYDTRGAELDAEGRLRNWWTEKDKVRFRTGGRRLVQQYDAYWPFPDKHVDGKRTLNENIADLAGIAVAYDAYKLSLGGKPAPIVQGLSGDQRFFLAYALSFRDKVRRDRLRQWLDTDEHAPDRYRVETVRNIDGWYDAFGVKPGDKLYLAPADRIRIW